MFRYTSCEYGCLDEIFRGKYTIEDWLRKAIKRCVKHIGCQAEVDGLQNEVWSYDFEFMHQGWDIMISVEGSADTYVTKYQNQEELLMRGVDLFSLISDKLNSIFCAVRKPDAFRRKEDFYELCIALALLEKQQGEGMYE